jgi:hypothetical protein
MSKCRLVSGHNGTVAVKAKQPNIISCPTYGLEIEPFVLRRKTMKGLSWIVAGIFVFISVSSGTALAKEKDPSKLPWNRVYVDLGYYIASLDSAFRLGSGTLGLGVDLDVENLLGLDTSDSAFRIDAGWRFTENKRHKLEFSWFAFHRDGTKFLDQSVEIPDGEEGKTILGPGNFDSKFDFDIIKLKYEYSFVLDDRIDLNVGAGLYVMPIEFGFTGVVDGVGQTSIVEDITAPLPVFGLGVDFAITPKWFIRQQFDGFYLEIKDFKGGIIYSSLALEYLPWKHFGFGLGGDYMHVQVEAEGEDYPGVDFVGSVAFNYFGARLYLKGYF